MNGPSWTEFFSAIGLLVVAFMAVIGYVLRKNGQEVASVAADVEQHDKTLYNPDTGMAVVIREIRTNMRWIVKEMGKPDEEGVGGD